MKSTNRYLLTLLIDNSITYFTDSSYYHVRGFLNAKIQHFIERGRYWIYSSNQKASL